VNPFVVVGRELRRRGHRVTLIAPDVFADVVTNAGLETPSGSTAGNSLCSNSEWNIRAEVADTRTGVKVAVNQGVALRVLETDATNACL